MINKLVAEKMLPQISQKTQIKPFCENLCNLWLIK